MAASYGASAWAQPTTVWEEDFESGGGSMTLSNGSQINQWVVGAAAGNPGQSMYISNDGGTTNNYDINMFSVVHAWHDIDFPAGMPAIDLYFDWQGQLEGCCDWINVWVVPTSFTPQEGVEIEPDGAVPTGRVQLGADLNQQSNWQSVYHTLSGQYAGTSARLVFEWKNDGSLGTPPSGAIDNILLQVGSCAPPENIVLNDLSDETAELAWLPNGADAYEYEVRTSGPPGSGPVGLTTSGTSPTSPVGLSGLSPSTNYTVYMRSLCDGGANFSNWAAGVPFSTPQVPLTEFPWTEDFEDGGSLFIQNGDQPNQWIEGDAVGNPGQSLYITNDEGNSNFYDINAASTVHAWRDLSLPDDMPAIDLQFDWHGLAESCCDYIKVWVAPFSFTPTAGTMIDAAGEPPTGVVQLGGNLNLQSEWQTASFTLSALYMGQDIRVIFEWHNDGSIGTAPGGAIDNILLMVGTCAKPEALVMADITANSGSLSWLDTGADSYEYEVRTSGAPGSGPDGLVLSGSTTTLPIALEGLDPGTVYTVYVRGICDGTPSAWSSGLQFVTAPGCGGAYYDSGGPSLPYSTNEDVVTVICPETPGQLVVLDFPVFSTEETYDKIFVFDGIDVSAPMFASTNDAGNGNTFYGEGGWWGEGPVGPFVATNETGCLTVAFVSDGSAEYDGWEGIVSCILSIDCAAGPAGPLTYCYSNNDNTVFSYAATAPTDPLTLSFTEGQLLVNDYITVHDGLNANADIIYMGNNGGNLAGLTLQALPGHNTLAFQIHSNTTGSCADGATNPHLKWYVGCGDAWVGMDELGGGAFEVYPNPTSGNLNIRLEQGWPMGVQVQVYDVSGRMVADPSALTGSGDTRTIQLDGLQTGNYYVQLVTDRWTRTRPVQLVR